MCQLYLTNPSYWACDGDKKFIIFAEERFYSFIRMAEGDIVARYKKQKLLGKGTFGEAWLVVSTASGRSGDPVIHPDSQ